MSSAYPPDPERDPSPSPDGAAADGEEAAGGVAAGEVLPAGEEAPGAEPASEVDELLRERDEFKDMALRLQAEFDNYRKRTMKQQSELVERAAERLAEQLLPVLDAFDLAVAHHPDDETVKQLWGVLWGTLEKEGLERIDPQGAPFDPAEHEAVSHEPAEAGDTSPVVASVLRAGYRWKHRILRTAMVTVRG